MCGLMQRKNCNGQTYELGAGYFLKEKCWLFEPLPASVREPCII